ncbi:MAG TPA: acyltransferase, partial [Flavisolibacter sp.]|nr:acyltransferase [Flavisolibacter sp.]
MTVSLSAKPHYPILDGLRGVAAILVVIFHLFEAHATGHATQIINHGYLAVDFFFALSGFVVGYAYDDRWTKMSIGSFFRRRLIRLQPMVIMGMLIGAICFYLLPSSIFPAMSQVPVWKMLLIMLIGMCMLPVPPSMDIRGWHEMYPLNGPAWSLFFEYLANILYALGIRKFSKTPLTVLVFLAACFLIHMAVGYGDVVGGWALEGKQLHIGFARVLYPFFAGLLLSRMLTVKPIKQSFLLCSLLLALVLALPRMGGEKTVWLNGLYEAGVIILIFPLIVYLGACGVMKGNQEKRFCNFLGGISYPLYITHYPLIYLYTGWV